MQATGIVRRIDSLGHIAIPKALRQKMDLGEGSTLAIFVEGSDIVLRKYQASCIFCDEAADIVQYEGKNICRKCLAKLKGISTD